MKKILIFLVIAINSISLAWADLQDGIDAYADQNFAILLCLMEL